MQRKNSLQENLRVIYVLKSVFSIVRKFSFSSWVSFYYVRLELTAFHILRSVPIAASSCSGDQIARQEIREQQEQRKAGCTGLKCLFGIAVKELVCQKLEMEDYKCHRAEYVLYKSSWVFSPLFIPRDRKSVV